MAQLEQQVAHIRQQLSDSVAHNRANGIAAMQAVLAGKRNAETLAASRRLSGDSLCCFSPPSWRISSCLVPFCDTRFSSGVRQGLLTHPAVKNPLHHSVKNPQSCMFYLNIQLISCDCGKMLGFFFTFQVCPRPRLTGWLPSVPLRVPCWQCSAARDGRRGTGGSWGRR